MAERLGDVKMSFVPPSKLCTGCNLNDDLTGFILDFCTLLILYCNFSGLVRTLEREHGAAIAKYVAKPFSYSCALSACPRRLDQWGRIEVPEIYLPLCGCIICDKVIS